MTDPDYHVDEAPPPGTKILTGLQEPGAVCRFFSHRWEERWQRTTSGDSVVWWRDCVRCEVAQVGSNMTPI